MSDAINESKFSKWVIVQAYKHDGHLHRQWTPAYLVEETDDYWALASRASLVTEADGRRWMTKEHAIFFLFKKKWMNVICMMKKGGGICYYVNIASPTILDQGMLRYIDYDLDVKYYPDETIKQLDEQEFERHILTYAYKPELTNAARKSFREVIAMVEHKAFPFVDEEIEKLFDKFTAENPPFIPRHNKDR